MERLGISVRDRIRHSIQQLRLPFYNLTEDQHFLFPLIQQVYKLVLLLLASQSQCNLHLERLLRDLGGVQPYVLWLGVALHVLLLVLVIGAIREGLLEGGR